MSTSPRDSVDYSLPPASDDSLRGKSRREFLKEITVGGMGLAWYAASEDRLAAAENAVPAGSPLPSASLSWLGDIPPLLPVGVTLGVPWARGLLPPGSNFVVRGKDGAALPTQSWPLAFWPDGSIKWTGLSLAAEAPMASPLTVEMGSSPTPQTPLTVQETGQSIAVSTGLLVCRIARSGANLIDSLFLDGKEIGRNARLVASREDRSEFASKGVLRLENYVSRVTSVTVEQSGPVRGVVRIDGAHATAEREWLPFTMRLYFTAGLNSIRMVHSFVFDGDAKTDFIRGLGIAFTVPFREQRQNRHVRFATDGDGVWGEPVMMSPGYREVLVKGALQMNQDQMQGKRIPNLETLDPKTKASFESVAVWDGFRLAQLAPDSFSIDKRTGAASSWLHNLNGRRAHGLAFLGDVSGGLAVGVRHFWQKYPAALEIANASTDAGELYLWFWSPDAPAMDLRHYDTIGHDGRISYEDYQEGFSTPNGVANTHELTLWALSETPSNTDLAALAQTSSEPPLLTCQPQHYYDTHVLGVWSLPNIAGPDAAKAEEQLERALKFFQTEVEMRRWYGFWDFGDFMRTYSTMRHGWLYDIGGHAWNNTELMPDAWLWFTFLRTGRADVFRLAEAMTRNTSEVDVYHAGRFKGLGSRHNVSHWGCGAKEARISEAWLKRFYYYLTADERTGDLMREVLGVDETIARIQPLRHQLNRADAPIVYRIGPDWLALASNWMTEWERTGNTRYRDYVHAGMKSIGAMPEAFVSRQAFRMDPTTKELFDVGEPNLKATEFLDLFGGDQIMFELTQLIDCPPFAAAWARLCEKWATDPKWKGSTKMRIMAYRAVQTGDAEMKRQAWQLLVDSLSANSHDRFPAAPNAISGPDVAEPVQELLRLDTPGASQWAINILTTMELAHP